VDGEKQAQRGFTVTIIAGAMRRVIRSFTAIAKAIRRAIGLNGFATIAMTKPNPHDLLLGYIA